MFYYLHTNHPIQPCPVGFRSESSFGDPSRLYSDCSPCAEPLRQHDWLYLAFMCLLQLLCQYYLIDRSVNRLEITGDALLLHLSATLEVTLAAVLTLAVYSRPFASFRIDSCGSHRLADWYTVLYNPAGRPADGLRCTTEAVYPLYSMLFTYFFFTLVFLLLVRAPILRLVRDRNAVKTVYLTMYLIPTLACLHLLAAGLICKPASAACQRMPHPS